MHALNILNYVKKSWLLLLAFGLVFIGLLSFTPTVHALTDAEINDKAADFCGKGDDARNKACRAGYRAGAKNESTDTCDSRTTPQEKNSCKRGYDEGKKIAPAPTGSPTSPGSGPGSGSNTPPPDEDLCDATADPLSWIICPVIDLGSKLTNFVFKDIVRPFLEDVPLSAHPDDPSYNAWKQFRTLGNIVLIGSLIAVVYAQTRGDR